MKTPSPVPFGARVARGRGARSARGFTLVEIVVATLITALIVTLLVGVLNHVTSGWAKASGRLSTAATARVIFEQIGPDLQAALFRDDGNAWMAVTVRRQAREVPFWVQTGAPARQKPDALSLLLNPTTSVTNPATGRPMTVDLPIEYARYGTGGAWLRFFTVRRGANNANNNATGSTLVTNISAPVAVGYQIARRPTSANPVATTIAYSLYRMEARPAPLRNTNGSIASNGVLDAGYNLVQQFTISTTAPYDRIDSRFPGNRGAQGDPASLYNPNSASAILGSVLAENVVDFGVRFYERDDATQKMKLIYPADANGRLVSNRYSHEARASTVPVSYLNKFPEVIEVMVRILTEEGARQISLLEANPNQLGTRPQQYRTDAEWWWGVVEENSHVYVRRIEVAAPPQQ